MSDLNKTNTLEQANAPPDTELVVPENLPPIKVMNRTCVNRSRPYTSTATSWASGQGKDTMKQPNGSAAF